MLYFLKEKINIGDAEKALEKEFKNKQKWWTWQSLQEHKERPLSRDYL